MRWLLLVLSLLAVGALTAGCTNRVTGPDCHWEHHKGTKESRLVLVNGRLTLITVSIFPEDVEVCPSEAP